MIQEKKVWNVVFGTVALASLGLGIAGTGILASCAEESHWVATYVPQTEADKARTRAQRTTSSGEAAEANRGCIECHEHSKDPHPSGVSLGCVDCHGGDPLATDIEDAHPKPRHPERWGSSANPERTNALLNDESWDWIRFVNPGDLRVASTTCGGCHREEAIHVPKSLMATASHFWGVAPYANGIVSNKSSIFGESYGQHGTPQIALTVPGPTEAELERSVIPFVAPLPQWEVMQPGNQFRVFEKGSRLGGAGLGFLGAPVPLIGLPDKLEDPGRPNNRLSDRGLGTLNRIDLPLLNIFKTRLNDPFLWFLGTNDQPGDYRSSGCTACHMIYANDRDPVHSGPWARFGNEGMGNASEDAWGNPIQPDPTIPTDEPGHPIAHQFTRAIPSSQCMVCHHHQPNSFVNSYYGYTMWAYDTDGEGMWPEKEAHPTDAERHEILSRNPEGAAQTGKWGDRDFLQASAENNDKLKHTQFADYHGHGWMFRGAFKMDRGGNMLDAEGNKIPYEDVEKFQGVIPKLGSNPSAEEIKNGAFAPPEGRAVHLKDIHAERGMHCVDCHFEQDSHGDGKLYSEYQAAIEITCQDCHGTVNRRADLETSGPATGSILARDGTLTDGDHRHDLRDGRTPFGRARMDEDQDGNIIQRSMLYKDLEWKVPQVRDTVTAGHPDYNAKAAWAKTQPGRDNTFAHSEGGMECYTCHTSWITSCFGCHLPQEANWKTPMLHDTEHELRNYATYNPQVVRDSEFMLGVSGNVKGNRVAPVRSSSALVLSSQDGVRQKIYGQVPTIATNGMSSQLMNTHFPHTVRTRETRSCDDCHVSESGDNNAWLAQTYLLGTNTVGLMGNNLFVGMGTGGFSAVRVTEWEEPQAVIGSHLHSMAYPDRYQAHVDHGEVLEDAEHHHGKNALSLFGGSSDVRSLQLRGEYLYTANGPDGFRVFDVANVVNKGFSEKLVTAPVSPLGQDTHVDTSFATAVALPFNNHISMSRKWRPENKEQEYKYKGRSQNMHELYRYAYVTDREEGLLIIDIDCLTDFDPQNNFIELKKRFNPNGALDGAVNLTIAGTIAYICCDRGIVAVDIDDPLAPEIITEVGAPAVVKPSSIQVQFRYAFVTDAEGVKVLDVTDPRVPTAVPGASVKIDEAHDIYVGKTYGYVAAGSQGLVILDLEHPTRPVIDQTFSAEGAINDLRQVKVASTNDSVFAYLADGENGARVLKLIGPNDGGRSAYGFSPRPKPELIATYPTDHPALALSKALDRDRAVDESGNQVTLFGRIGGRPMNLEEMQRLYLSEGKVYAVGNEAPDSFTSPVSAGSSER